MARLVVVGGGISGLAAAWSARLAAARSGVMLEVIVLERSGEVGGKVHTVARDGWMVEGGPSGFLAGQSEAGALIDACGLTDDLITARAQARRRFLYRNGALHEMRPSPLGIARSGIMSARGLLRLGAEPFVRHDRERGDETVWSFAARRLGAEAADRLVAPMALGVFAGDARRLSLASAFPRIAALEAEHGSLIRGALARRGRGIPRTLTSFRNGMQSLPQRLAERGGFRVRCNAVVRRIGRVESGWRVMVGGDRATIDTDALIVATEPWSAAQLFAMVDEAGAEALRAIPCPPVTVVALGFNSTARAHIPDGFGALVSRGEGIRMLGNLWETSIFPGRGPAGGILVRALFGGAVDESIGALDDATMLALAKSEVARVYRLGASPVFESVVRIERAIPQYEVGHADRVAAIERAVASLPGLDITGFGLRGVAFSDAAADGVRTGERIGRWLAAREGSEA